jgi:hypothetical protein
MKEFDPDFEALKSMTRLAWQLDFQPVAVPSAPGLPEGAVDA